MANVLVDSDVLVDHLRGHRPYERGEDRPHVSVITRAELFAGNVADEPRVRALLASMTELDVDRPIAERAGQIKRETGIALTDAAIAATALQHGLALVTRNTRDFERVPGLRLAGLV